MLQLLERILPPKGHPLFAGITVGAQRKELHTLPVEGMWLEVMDELGFEG